MNTLVVCSKRLVTVAIAVIMRDHDKLFKCIASLNLLELC